MVYCPPGIVWMRLVSTKAPLIVPTTAPISMPSRGAEIYQRSESENDVLKNKAERLMAIPQPRAEARIHRKEPVHLPCRARHCSAPVMLPATMEMIQLATQSVT